MYLISLPIDSTIPLSLTQLAILYCKTPNRLLSTFINKTKPLKGFCKSPLLFMDWFKELIKFF